ncbi:MAG: DNA-directed DNA polymerase I [Candidatus Marsarchaeota archaeon]|nr:DNA-directed DNA polymerase I [Candidatus Marsarchaeota archaeon]
MEPDLDLNDEHEESETAGEEPSSEEEAIISAKLETPANLDESVLMTVLYDGKAERAVALLYEKKSERIYAWYDNTGHRPYLLTDIPTDKLRELPEIAKLNTIEKIEYVKKYHALDDKLVNFTKVVARDPLTIGGRPDSLRQKLPAAWEARIRYANCFMYDRGLIPGATYKISNYNLVPVVGEPPADAATLASTISGDGADKDQVLAWFRVLSDPAPNFKRLALDIEVETSDGKVPNADKSTERVIAVSFYGSDGLKRALVLMRDETEPAPVEDMPKDLEIEFYDDEAALLKQCFKLIAAYPVVITFNGDNFDLKYLYHRAERLGIPLANVPITLGQREARLATGIHLDLYQFFKNRAIQIYAFDGKYKEYGLEAIAAALLGKHKIDLGGKLAHELSVYELALYCFRDSQITFELTNFNDSLVMKLIIMLMRISRTGMDDLTRIGVSSWIKNLMYAMHRERNYLIVNPEDIAQRKNISSTHAMIKGKKYKGAIVISPSAGVYFGVTVLDFASLYPSILKEYNLSYETVRCPHPECRTNLVPETEHWRCTKLKGIASQLVGLLRDLRVLWFKPKANDSQLSALYRSWYDVAQRALKVYVNASYGVFGAETFPFYCLPVAESTAAIARFVITSTVKRAQEMGMKVLYGDTDSLFVLNPPREKINDLVHWARANLKVDLDIDKQFRYVAFSERKKNYFGIKNDGSVDIKGLLGKKRNTPPLIKQAFQKSLTALSAVKSPSDFEQAKSEVRDILKQTVSTLKSRNFDVNDLAITVMLNKNPTDYKKNTPQHIKAARLSEDKTGRKLSSGDIIRFVKTYDGVQPVDLVSTSEVDTSKYIDALRTTFDQVLDAIGLEMDEVMGERKLESFFMGGSA